MKVLLSAFDCLPGHGSEPGNGWQWAMALAGSGHEVTVLTRSDYREAILAGGPGGVDFRFIDFIWSRARRLSLQLAIYDSYLRWQDSALKYIEPQARQYDVVHHVTWGSLRLGSKLWQLPVPLVYGPIGGGQKGPARYWRYFGRTWPTERLRAASAGPLLTLNSRSRETIQNAAVTLATNSATAAVCRRLGGADVRFMFSDGLASGWLGAPRRRPVGTPMVLWVGRLIPLKAPTLAVQAFAGLRRAMPARLVIAGDGPLRAHVEATADRLGIAQDVQLLGHVSWDEVRRLYDSASVFFFTSLRDSAGPSFLEALGRGLPAVALDHHGIADLDVGPAAVKVAVPPRPRDLPHRLTSALRTILCDGQWESRSDAAVKYASGHLWSQKAAAATQIYRQVAGSKAAGKVNAP